MISSEQIAALPIYGALNVANTVVVCSTVAECSSGTMAMFTDAYTNGANGGYIEFGLGWPNAENAINGWSGGQMDGGADFSDFYLVVELEDNTPDATPLLLNMTDITLALFYIDGPRTYSYQ